MPRKKKDYGFKPFEKSPGADNRHIRITLNMMESKAWKQLSVHAACLYLAFKQKYTGSNDDDISFTYKESEKIMNERTFMKSLDQLLEMGFIRVVQNNWTVRKANIYGFSDQWQYFGTKNFTVKPRMRRAKAD